MKKITYAKNVASLLKGSTAICVIAPALTLARPPKIFDTRLQPIFKILGKDARPGNMGSVVSSITDLKAGPHQLIIAALPNQVSRYNCPARSECVHRLLSQAKLESHKKAGVLLILDDTDHLLPVLNKLARTFPLLSLKSGKQSSGSVQVLAMDKKGKVLPIPSRAKLTLDCSREAARLVDTPPTDMNPEALAKDARKLLRGIKNVRVSEIVGADLLKARLGGIHAVGRTALKQPRLLVATYTPPSSSRSKKLRHLALVGKGITYDTGGLHIKGRGGMETMKADMGGSAAVLGAFRVLAASGCKHKLSLVMCLAENAVGPRAYKPDDVITLHSGKTVEINNTDAEGRIVLGDGVSYAARVLKADTILDAATLTGAQLIATGINHAAIFSNDAALEEKVRLAGFDSGDLVHPMPFAPELYKREFTSRIADMKNSVRNRGNAQASCAAQFIYWHIEDTDAKWCHVDLAGPAFINDRATGYGTALLAEAVRRLG